MESNGASLKPNQMTDADELAVHWEEGLYLYPHHFQVLQRSLIRQLEGQRELYLPYSYGCVDSKLNHDALKRGLVKYDRLQVVMKSGIEVRFPEQASLPAIDLKEALASGAGSVTILLGVPVFQTHRTNTVDPAKNEDLREKRRYLVEPVMTNDENTGRDEQVITRRRVNARLLLDTQDTSDLETLPILRVKRDSAIGGKPGTDATFVPACMNIHADPALFDCLDQLLNQIIAARDEDGNAWITGGYSAPDMNSAEISKLLRLQALNKAAGTLRPMLKAPMTSPYAVFVELNRILGELGPLAFKDDPCRSLPDYDHDNPLPAINDLCRKISAIVGDSAAVPDAVSLPFMKQPDGYYLARLGPEHTSGGKTLYLGVKSASMDSPSVTQIVTDATQFKIMNHKNCLSLIPGIPVEETRRPPSQLPTPPGLYYFMLKPNFNERIWEFIKAEQEITIHWPQAAGSDFEMALYLA